MTRRADSAIGAARRGTDEGIPTVTHADGNRSYRMRHWARRELDLLLEEWEVQDLYRWCDGLHHLGQDHDWWGVCTSLSAGMPERSARGRDLVGAGWSP